MKKLLERFPRAEAVIRNIYWRSSTLQNLLSRYGKRRTSTPVTGFSIDDLILTLRHLGIATNDVVLVHSNMKQLAGCGLSPSEIIESFINQLCPDGTLVCPTFPLYRHEKQGKERFTADMSNVELTYDVQKTRTWTGELGRVLMKKAGSRRSLHPLNTITAYGTAVDKIFEKETISSLDLPCGPNSTWAALAALNAKVVMLGVDMAHSLTMIHVAEDCHENLWPVKGWYRDRFFRLIDAGQQYSIKVRERHPRWALSYAERKLSRDLYRCGVAQSGKVGSLDYTVLDSISLLDFLDSRKVSGYPYYLTWLARI